MINNKQIS